MDIADLNKIFKLTEEKKSALLHGLEENEKAKQIDDFFYLDLETAPDWEAAERAGVKRVIIPEPTPEADLPELNLDGTVPEITARYGSLIEPPSEYVRMLVEGELSGKSRKGVLDFLNKLEGASPDREKAEKQIKMLSVCPESCKIVAAGYADGDGEVFSVCLPTEAEESNFLGNFWEHVRSGVAIVGFNHIEFDIPVIKARSIRYGIPATRRFGTKPWDLDLIDLYARRFNGRIASGFGKTLKDLAALSDLPVPAGETSGADVNRLYEAEDWDTLKHYVKSDVEITRALHKLWQGYYC